MLTKNAELTRQFRQMLTPGAGNLMPGAGNALTARVIEATGHSMLMVSGAAVDEPGDAILDAKHRLPFTARFAAIASMTAIDVSGNTLLLRQIDTYGNEIDRIRLEK